MKLLHTLFALVATTGLAAAQINISGNVFDGSGGPLLTGNVYHMTSILIVPVGQTLTVQPGAIVKSLGARFIVDGTLNAQGTLGNEVIFTSIHDDAAGGDTNGNGVGSVGAPGQWDGIEVRGGSTTNIDHAIIRYHGQGAWSGLYYSGAIASSVVTNSSISSGSTNGIDLNNLLVFPQVSDCSFDGNGNAAVMDMRVDCVPGFMNNTASGNGESLFVTIPSPTADTTITAANMLNDVIVFNTTAIVPPGVTLRLEEGVTIKYQNSRLVVDGTLEIAGTALDPVTITSIHDDTIGGDINDNGAGSVGAPGQWDGIELRAGSTTNIDHAIIRYHGQGAWSGLYYSGAIASSVVTNSSISSGSTNAIDLNNIIVFPQVSNCTFDNNGNAAVMDMRVDSVPGFTDNTASGNSASMFVTIPSPTIDTTITAANMVNDVIVFNATSVIPVGVTLRLEEGVAIRYVNSRLVVDGTLEIAGTALAPVTITSIHDDTIGGDINNNGVGSVGAPGQWDGIELRNGSSADIDHAIVRYHGQGGWSGLYFGAIASATVSNSSFSNGSTHGTDLNGQNIFPQFSNCSFDGNAGAAVADVLIDSVPGFLENSAAGNGAGNVIVISNPTPAADVTLLGANMINDVLIFSASCNVPVGRTLRMEEGVHVKVNGRIFVDGTLELVGSAHDPVVLTSHHDDSVGGDTNSNGVGTVGAPGQWDGVELRTGSLASQIEHTLIRFCGSGGWSGVHQNSTGQISLRRVRVDSSSTAGFMLTSFTQAEDLTAWACATGIRLVNGSSILRRASVNACTTGIQGDAAFTGQVREAISFGNGNNWSGLANATVEYSAGPGVPAGTGNMAVDPLFVNAAGGNLRLDASSPCIETGDPLEFATGQDQSTFPRLMDGDLDKIKRMDIGAYEFDNLEMSVRGNPTPGGALTVEMNGSVDFADVYMFLSMDFQEVSMGRYGPLFVDLSGPHDIMAWPAPPNTVTVELPVSLPTPFHIVMQAAARIEAVKGAAGNLSNPVRITID